MILLFFLFHYSLSLSLNFSLLRPNTSPSIYMLTHLSFGDPSRELNAKFSFNTQFFWVLGKTAKQNGYDESLSKTYQKKREMNYIKYSNTNITGVPSREMIVYNDKFNISDFCFLLINQTIDDPHIKNFMEKYDCIIGLSLSFDYNARRYNFIGELQNTYKVSKRMFYLNFNGSSIVIGESPPSIQNDTKHSHIHRINVDDRGKVVYRLLLDSFFISYSTEHKNKSLFTFVNQSAIFSVETSAIEIPYEFYSAMRQTIFAVYIKENICKEHDEDNYLYITCKEEFSNLNSLSLVFEGWTYKFSYDDIWEEAPDKSHRLLLVNNKTRKEKMWVLGICFMRKFLTVFDIDLGQVIIYSNNQVQ